MILLEDTRQQAGKHDYKHEYFLANGIAVRRTTLNVGDYQLSGVGNCAVDTKKDIQELIGNVQFKAPKKSVIEAELAKIRDKYDVGIARGVSLFEIIWNDDSDRDVEAEITKYAYQYRLDEGIVKPLCDLYVKRRGRFHRELIRAKIEGVKLVILVENAGGRIKNTNIANPVITDLKDLHKWVNPRLFVRGVGGKQKYPDAMKGVTLMKACMTMERKYGCKFEFCAPEDAGGRIMEILNKEWLGVNDGRRKRKDIESL